MIIPLDYSAYENPSAFTGINDNNNYYGQLPDPSVLGEGGLPQEEQPVDESADFTSEEIAASYGRYTDVTVVAAAKRVKLFTYSISSVGAVNPLSDIEVSCILGEQAANEVGQVTCDLFFDTLVQQYNTLLKEAQNNAAL